MALTLKGRSDCSRIVAQACSIAAESTPPLRATVTDEKWGNTQLSIVFTSCEFVDMPIPFSEVSEVSGASWLSE
jgi:hypothetical protein